MHIMHIAMKQYCIGGGDNILLFSRDFYSPFSDVFYGPLYHLPNSCPLELHRIICSPQCIPAHHLIVWKLLDSKCYQMIMEGRFIIKKLKKINSYLPPNLLATFQIKLMGPGDWDDEGEVSIAGHSPYRHSNTLKLHSIAIYL